MQVERSPSGGSGGRVSNAWEHTLLYGIVSGKLGVIPYTPPDLNKLGGKDLSLSEHYYVIT